MVVTLPPAATAPEQAAALTLVSIILLIVLLVQKEILRDAVDAERSPIGGMLDIAIGPLMAIFWIAVALQVYDLLV
jgi:hypothetical protein